MHIIPKIINTIPPISNLFILSPKINNETKTVKIGAELINAETTEVSCFFNK